ncbi:enoyl-CoA hydratase/isomerase family protein [Roseospira marina]|uniref:Enoyl-CoA hydratase/isomerase family protein n=1 Tax=Roseospira marina TaxID=140057 RepID=A0A5M6IF82_9PROT|nr:enoyl-CoA hydratase/isomerase family protein [Roseospira marina]KAA5606944.1 enoyl-CoA hydratase/isomerase family protein [Roseospira marina]MBB4312881.1 methylglutaconyl-CoA hydratase [Roseospira marina]MBB5086346.1 methylglutaconyl-CoA hydratase [Roseospira marina]
MTDSQDALRLERDDRGVATVTLTRPARHNAFDDALIARLTEAFVTVGADPDVRVVVLAAEGPSFSSGADLSWMKRMAGYSAAENQADALALATLLETIDRCPKPVVALVQGAAYGGGVGLVAACDIAIATAGATFALSEVKLGIIPAAISPYVLNAIGPRAARRYMLTGERFDAEEAHRIGLLHDVVGSEELIGAGELMIRALMQGGPAAQTAVKDLLRAVADQPPDTVMEETAGRIAAIRVSPEGQEGLGAFLDKRTPSWIKE